MNPSYNAPPTSGGMGDKKPSAQFFSMTGGTPVPVSSQSQSGPPTTAMPNQYGGGGPPMMMGVGGVGGGVGGPPMMMGSGGPPMMGGGGIPSSSNILSLNNPTNMPDNIQHQQFFPPPPAMNGMAPGGVPPPPGMPPGPPGASGGGGMMPPTTPGSGAQFYSTGANPNSFGTQQAQMGLPAGFDSSSNLANYGMPGNNGYATPGSGGADAVTPTSQQGQIPMPTLADVDLNIKCNPNFLRPSVGKIVNHQAHANASKIPIGAMIQPMFGDKGTDNEEIDVVDFGQIGIVRCKRCRTYINPFVAWLDNGRKWRCNICGLSNDTPTAYFSHLDDGNKRKDRFERPELSKCCVEFVAPGDYMVRPPQPPVYFFVIDVSSHSIQSGMLQYAVAAIKNSLDTLPGGDRTQIGFITFDSSIHYYNLKSTLSAPQMIVVSDIIDIIQPIPEDLLVNLKESRAVVDNLLENMPLYFATSTITSTCTGSAINASKRVIQHIGGKLCLFQSSLPTLGEGALKSRENPALLGTDKEHTLLNTADQWYKEQALNCSKQQISIDTFLFCNSYTDLSSLSSLSKYTAGSTFYYNRFHGPRDGVRFATDLEHNLTRSTAFESVMRVRATKGIKIANYYGNYYIRGSDLLALPNCTSDSVYSFDLAFEDPTLAVQLVTIQAALLFTNSAGERRIRVITTVIPVCNSLQEMVDSIDTDAMVNLLTKQAILEAERTGFENTRHSVHKSTVDMLRCLRAQGQFGAPSQEVSIPATLQLLPLYSMSLQKSLVLRGGQMPIDERAFYMQLASCMNVADGRSFIYPNIFSLHDMGSDVGLPSDNPEDDETQVVGPMRVKLPPLTQLSLAYLSSDGIYLLDNGVELLMWIGREVNSAFINDLFNIPSFDNVDMATLQIVAENSDFSHRLNEVIIALRAQRSRYMQLHFIRQTDVNAAAYFSRYLVEDKANFKSGTHTYEEYYTAVCNAIVGRM